MDVTWGTWAAADMQERAIVCATLVLPFLVASRYLIGSWLFKEYELKRAWVGHLFSSTFALSVAMLALAIYEIKGVLQPSVRWLTWRFVLHALTLELVRTCGERVRAYHARGQCAHAVCSCLPPPRPHSPVPRPSCCHSPLRWCSCWIQWASACCWPCPAQSLLR